MIETITYPELRSFIMRTQSSKLSIKFMKIIEEAIALHVEHIPVIGTLDLLNPRSTLVLVMWAQPFNGHTIMIKLQLISLGQSALDMFAKRILHCGIYVGKDSNVIFKDTISFTEEDTDKHNPMYNWHYRLIENNYDNLEPIVPEFIAHILNQAAQVVNFPQEIIDAIIATGEDNAVSSEDHDSFEEA